MLRGKKLEPSKNNLPKIEGEAQQIQAWESFPVENEKKLVSQNGK